jgi:hypothetical protein
MAVSLIFHGGEAAGLMNKRKVFLRPQDELPAISEHLHRKASEGEIVPSGSLSLIPEQRTKIRELSPPETDPRRCERSRSIHGSWTRPLASGERRCDGGGASSGYGAT